MCQSRFKLGSDGRICFQQPPYRPRTIKLVPYDITSPWNDADKGDPSSLVHRHTAHAAFDDSNEGVGRRGRRSWNDGVIEECGG